MTRGVCIVDAYSTGSELPQRFKSHGWNVVHVASNAEAPELLKSFDDSFIDVKFSEADFGSTEMLIDELRNHEFDVVVPGTETGTGLADEIAHELSLCGNNPASSAARRNKTLMQSALREASLPHIRGISACSIHQISEFVSSSGIQYPFVVKPESSAGSDDVYFCNNMDEIETAFRCVIGKTNAIGARNEKVLVQECLSGGQYYVNGLTIDGSHYFFEVWEEKKLRLKNNRIVCDKEIFVLDESDAVKEIKEYLRQALDVLEIKWGATHSEIMFTDTGPILIEAAARMQGSFSSRAVEQVLALSHPSALVSSIIDPEKFVRSQINSQRREGEFVVVLLISDFEGVVKDNKVTDFAAMLPSFVDVAHTVERGETLQLTVDLFTSPGSIYLAHESAEQIEADYRQIREWERQGKLYEIE